MYLAHPVKGGKLNYCDATSWYSDRVKAAVRGLSNSKNCSPVARPAVSRDQLCQLVRFFSLWGEFSLLAVLGLIFLLRINSEAIPMRRKVSTEGQ